MVAVKPANEYRSWPPATGLPTLQIGHEAARELAARVMDGVNALPRRGLEIGGLLIGTVRDNAVYVDSLLPLHSRYPSGPVFIVEDDDALQALEKAATIGEIVGLYRSRTDEVVELDSQFEYMLQSVARSPIAAFVVVAQSRNTKPVARAGVRLRDSSFHWLGESFPMTAWLQSSIPAQVPAPVALPVAPLSGSERNETPVVRYENSADRKHRVWLPWAIGAGLACAAIAFISLRTPEPAASRADQAVVPDATPQRPALDTRSRTREESLAPEPEPVEAATIPQRIPDAAEAPRAAQPKPALAPESRPAPVRKFTAPPQAERRPAVALRVPDPGPGTPIRIGSISGAAVPNSVWQPQPGGPLPPAPANTAVQFTPPVLARQPRPVVIPPDLRRLLDAEVVLATRVSVDERGRVVKAVPLQTMDRVQQSIWHFYSAAIGLWEFDPAVQNGKPVAAETILRFRVQPAR